VSTRFKLIIVAFMATICSTVSAQEKDGLGGVDIKSLHIQMEDAEGNYTVINERMDETGTAAALFGVAGAVVFSVSFTGYNSAKTGGGLSGTWTNIMNAALEDLARQISFSTDLKDALESAGMPAMSQLQMSITTGS